MKNYQSAISFGIIGLGRFGSALAISLAEAGFEVLALDQNEKKIRNMQNIVSQAMVVEDLDKSTLKEAGIQNCETVIVCVGEEQQVSIITTLNVVELGVPRIISKAVSMEHGRVLSKIGADVIYPERQQALRLAQILTSSRAIDGFELSDEFKITEFQLTEVFDHVKISDADFRGNFGLNIIAIINEVDIIVEIDPSFVLKQNMRIVVIGKKDNMKKLENKLSD